MLHTLRTSLNDDVLFRNVLRGLQKDFYHQTVTSSDIEQYMSKATGRDLDPFFDQYLRDIRVPVFEYLIKGKTVQYRFNNIVTGFRMPVQISVNGGEKIWVTPGEKWLELKQAAPIVSVQLDPNYYILTKQLTKK